jgi:hypothetical protein
MRLMTVFATLALALTLGACAGKKIMYEGGAAAKSTTSGPGISSSVVWLKNQKDRIDVLLRITNEYPHPVTFKMTKAKMTFGGVSVAPNDFGGMMELGAGITTERVLIFKFGDMKPVTGVAEMVLVPEWDGKDLPPLKSALTVEKR